MNYAEAVAHLYALAPELAPSGLGSQRKFDLQHMHVLCAELGDPQKLFPSVLIAGTNGKGSTAATLASILASAGYRTGLYTSPHLIRVNERIQSTHPVLPGEYGAASVHGADGTLQLAEIPDDEFARLYSLVDQACERLFAAGRLPIIPSFFERLTALAFLFFAGSTSAPRIEIAVLEVGLGGRLDATNVVEPVLSVITDIALDHQEYLGDTLAQIAREKCGILRQGGTLITLSQHPEANQAIGEAAAALQVRGVNAAAWLPPAERGEVERREELPAKRNCYELQVTTANRPEVLRVDSPLSGPHQQRNISLAIAAAMELRQAHHFDLSFEAMASGIRNTRWPGRLEWFGERILLDVAHNPAGAWTLRSVLSSFPEGRPRTLLFSCLRDKKLEEMSRILFPLFDSSPGGDPARGHDHIVLTPIGNARAAHVDDLVEAARRLQVPAHVAPHASAALRQALNLTPPDGILVVTGSVYLVGEIRELLQEGAVA